MIILIRLLGCVTLKAGNIIACCEKNLDNASTRWVLDAVIFDINLNQVTVLA
ncbi:hypothetical protein AB6D20_000510 [Vibrio splendidus]|uniref:hypothetical protein n=1 Tax=Vibrio splendidus TaxID=29497 RepID=UPI0012FFFE7F|nr:hypothetical protein [Vibrio splendidus]